MMKASTRPWKASRREASLVRTLKTGVREQAASVTPRSCRRPIRVRAVAMMLARASADAGAHEALDELALEQEEGQEQRARGHQRGRGDDGPVHALIARRE